MLRSSGDIAANRAHSLEPHPDDPAHVVAARLRRSGHPYLRGVACEFSEGVLLLSGTVPTFYLKQVAQELACRTPGIDEVRNGLYVTGSAHQPARPAAG
jgi:osmotically-inducible protein OsmY